MCEASWAQYCQHHGQGLATLYTLSCLTWTWGVGAAGREPASRAVVRMFNVCKLPLGGSARTSGHSLEPGGLHISIGGQDPNAPVPGEAENPKDKLKDMAATVTLNGTAETGSCWSSGNQCGGPHWWPQQAGLLHLSAPQRRQERSRNTRMDA